MFVKPKLVWPYLLGIAVTTVLATGVLFHHRFVSAQTVPPDPTTSGVAVVLIPSVPTLMAADPVDIAVWIYPNGNQVTAAELRVTFDSTKLIPRSAAPYATSSALSLTLAGNNVSGHQALIYLGVNCQPTGCPIPDVNQKFLLATLQLRATASASGVTTLNLNDAVNPTLTAALAFDSNATKLLSNTQLSITPCHLNYDFTADGQVNIVDIMQAAAKWNATGGTAAYQGQFDIDHDGDIDITDIQTVANSWNTACIN